jgi:hypothetical protein
MKKLRLEDAINIGKEMGFDEFIVIEKETVRPLWDKLVHYCDIYNKETVSKSIKGYEDCAVCTLYLGTYDETPDAGNNNQSMYFPYPEVCIIIYDFWN